MRIGMLTGGGDCPGLNAVIRAVVRKGIWHYGDEFIGFMQGWRGVLDDVTMPLNLETTSGILQRGGTILKSSRTNVKKIEGGFESCLEGDAGREAGCADRPGRRRHAVDLAGTGQARRQLHGRAQDHRQRPQRNRRLLRLRYRRLDRYRGGRPAALHHRGAQPRAGGRGNGPRRRLDRRHCRNRGRRRRGTRPGKGD